MRRDGEQGGTPHGRRGRVQRVGLQLYGDLGKNQPQRQGAVPRASQHGEEPQHLPAVRLQGQVPAQRHEEDSGEVYAHVAPCFLNVIFTYDESVLGPMHQVDWWWLDPWGESIFITDRNQHQIRYYYSQLKVCFRSIMSKHARHEVC